MLDCTVPGQVYAAQCQLTRHQLSLASIMWSLFSQARQKLVQFALFSVQCTYSSVHHYLLFPLLSCYLNPIWGSNKPPSTVVDFLHFTCVLSVCFLFRTDIHRLPWKTEGVSRRGRRGSR